MSRPDPVTRAVLRSHRLMEAGLKAARGLFDGVWLGLLDDRRLAALDTAYYDRAPMYQDEAYNRSGLSSWEQHAVSTYFPAGCRVTVVGAGGGREVLALLAQGFDAMGFEPHPALAAFGARLIAAEGHGERVRVSPRVGWPPAAPPTDAVVIGWGAYMLIPGRHRRIAYLRATATALPDGGRVLLSYFARRGTIARFRVAARIGTALRRLSRRPPVEPGDALVPNFVHFFTREQIEAELVEAGFRPLQVGSDDYGWAVGEVVQRPVSAGVTHER
ncbi:putative methyltransferase [Blastococcus saxobsidens]|uniref:Putative methyltransferase n=1 Tax=Blastococcus saxobsidens (strain DD2) TaxID=1146883 RepID=H6RMZ0_BLASD|nr:putative methyltransferase [Blastococcus saxobsidens]CCG01343.1 putative methyltransferase [Blastococcus saxobsidens DD2]